MSEPNPDWIEQIVRQRCAAKDDQIAQLREALPALWGQYDDEGRKLWIDHAEAVRAKCEAIARGYDECDAPGYTVADAIAEAFASLEGKGEGK